MKLLGIEIMRATEMAARRELSAINAHTIDRLEEELMAARNRAESRFAEGQAAAVAGHVRVVPERAMSSEGVLMGIQEIMGTEGWQALHQELDASINDALDDTAQQPAPAGYSRDFAAGGCDYLRKFQSRLISLANEVKHRHHDTELEEEA